MIKLAEGLRWFIMKEYTNTEEVIYKKIKEMIINREFAPHEQLVEAVIAKKLGVSRTPIRSALKQLSFDGLVELIPRVGAFVAQTTLEEYVQIFEARLLIEKEVARLAAKNISDKDLEQFKEAMEQEIQSYQDRNIEAFINANDTMHKIIASASRNKYFVRYIEELTMRSNVYIIFHDNFHTKPFDDLLSIKEHRDIYDAIAARDPEAAAMTMENHVRSIYENLSILRVNI